MFDGLGDTLSDFICYLPFCRTRGLTTTERLILSWEASLPNDVDHAGEHPFEMNRTNIDDIDIAIEINSMVAL